jgi:hypothetical protein
VQKIALPNDSNQRRQATLETTTAVLNRPLHLNGYAAFLGTTSTIATSPTPLHLKKV